MDRYGRLLAYVHPRPARPTGCFSYNERLLEQGGVSPYFIWPPINPFRRSPSILEAVPDPGTAGEQAEAEA